MISAKSLSGDVYSYPAKTAGEFKQALSLEKGIPVKMIQLLNGRGRLSHDSKLNPKTVYSLLIEYGDGLREWVWFENPCALYENPAAVHLLPLAKRKYLLPFYVSSNPEAGSFLEQHPELIDWVFLSSNPSAIHILEKKLNKIDWRELSANPAAMDLLIANQDKIHWGLLSQNPSAIYLLEQNLDKVNWWNLSLNPAAIHLLEQNLDKVVWMNLSRNPAAIPFPRLSIVRQTVEQKFREKWGVRPNHMMREDWETIEHRYKTVVKVLEEVYSKDVLHV